MKSKLSTRFDAELDARVRNAAFAWLTAETTRVGECIPRDSLLRGFEFNGQHIALISRMEGIWKPRILSEAPLSILTSPKGRYADSMDCDGLLRYCYRGNDPDHPQNRWLRFAMVHKLPLVYFHGIAPGKYLAAWPVYIVRDDPSSLSVTVAVDEIHPARDALRTAGEHSADDLAGARRRYATALVRRRLHQQLFRERVLNAYRSQCAFCRLRHAELLNAAHIMPDSDPAGEPHVYNGLALCTLHHAAFDHHFIGLRPDLTIEVRPDILTEEDGPTMIHAIQGLHDKRIVIPRLPDHRPAAALVLKQYEIYLTKIPG